jgi:hypothetical protein
MVGDYSIRPCCRQFWWSIVIRLLSQLQSQESYRRFVYDDATGHEIVPGYTVQGNPTIEPPRVLWRLYNVTEWSQYDDDEDSQQDEQIFYRSA